MPHQVEVLDKLPAFPPDAQLSWVPEPEHCRILLRLGTLAVLQLIDVSFQFNYRPDTAEEPYEWEVRTVGREPLQLHGPLRDPVKLVQEFLTKHEIFCLPKSEGEPRCAVCGEPQFETPSGRCCANGHGGADSVYR